ncbi:MAG: hypothetical protein ABW068_11760 [Candidatus Thiodiazotropha sp.]
MNNQYRLSQDQYVRVTPAGAFHATAQSGDDPLRRLLRALLREDQTPRLDPQAIQDWTGLQGDPALEMLYRAQNLDWVAGVAAPERARPGNLETVLPELLPALSDKHKALLADTHGFYITATGFPHETATELSALSADIASLDTRHRGLTQHNLGLGSQAWALVDAAGNSQIGFWPIFIDVHRFVLILQGVPQLHHAHFAELVWVLSRRYGAGPPPSVPASQPGNT